MPAKTQLDERTVGIKRIEEDVRNIIDVSRQPFTLREIRSLAPLLTMNPKITDWAITQAEMFHQRGDIQNPRFQQTLRKVWRLTWKAMRDSPSTPERAFLAVDGYFNPGAGVQSYLMYADYPFVKNHCLAGATIVYDGPKGSGKCHRKGQRLIMFDGSLKAVEELVPGDLLMGPDSCPRTITSLARGYGPMVEVRPTRGRPFVVNDVHVLTLTISGSAAERSKHSPRAPRIADDVVDVPIREWAKWSRWRKSCSMLFHVGVDFPSTPRKEGLPLDPYFLGLLLGDGCFTANHHTPCITTTDKEVVDEIRRQASTLGLKVSEYMYNRTPSYAINGGMRGGRYKNPVTEALKTLGLLGCDSGTKFIPHCYLVASRADRLSLLAGLIDTDGSIGYGCGDYTSKSLRLSEDIAFLARSLGFFVNLRSMEAYCQTGGGGTYYRLGISGDLSLIPTQIMRKRSIPRRQRKNALRDGFVIVPLPAEEEYYGFTLDGDGRYLLDDFTVTHNTDIATSDMAKQARLKQDHIDNRGKSLLSTYARAGSRFWRPLDSASLAGTTPVEAEPVEPGPEPAEDKDGIWKPPKKLDLLHARDVCFPTNISITSHSILGDSPITKKPRVQFGGRVSDMALSAMENDTRHIMSSTYLDEFGLAANKRRGMTTASWVIEQFTNTNRKSFSSLSVVAQDAVRQLSSSLVENAQTRVEKPSITELDQAVITVSGIFEKAWFRDVPRSSVSFDTQSNASFFPDITLTVVWDYVSAKQRETVNAGGEWDHLSDLKFAKDFITKNRASEKDLAGGKSGILRSEIRIMLGKIDPTTGKAYTAERVARIMAEDLEQDWKKEVLPIVHDVQSDVRVETELFKKLRRPPTSDEIEAAYERDKKATTEHIPVTEENDDTVEAREGEADEDEEAA